jgi:2-polyprenyl-3-methyl-5-hydroxy-6-metoxy-1,4-benzoquinol methylase
MPKCYADLVFKLSASINPDVSTKNVRELLFENPNIFAFFNLLIGVRSRTKSIISDYVCPRSGEVVADIACGRGEFSKELASTHYIGIDNNSSYIGYAERHYSNFGTFHCCDVSDLSTSLQGNLIDTALLIGVLHHLTNNQARDMIKDIGMHMSDGGKIVSVDPVFTPDQGLISRLIAASDRGKYVRSVDEHHSLFGEGVDICKSEIREDWLRIPYTHLVIVSTFRK